MARRTVEDCMQRVPNHFELVLLAAGRSKSLDAGADPMVSPDGDKNPVVALREIGQDAVDLKLLHEGVVSSLQQYAKPTEADSDEQELKEVEAELAGVTTEDMLYTDREFVDAESFQVVEGTDA